MTAALELVYASARKHAVFPNIVCIHGLGNEAESTWHHGETGKTWNKDEEFMELLDGSCRVLNYSFNAAISANLSAAGILFHAHDLLACLSSAIIKGGSVGPFFFVAHSWGGIILKKAVHLAWTNPDFKHIKDSLAGLFFLGTPHVHHDMGVILDAVRATVALHRYEDDEIPESDIRLFAMAVQQINDIFSKCRPDGVFVSSFWELRPTQIDPETRQLFISEDCKLADVDDGLDGTMDCNHADLARFPSPADSRFRQFVMNLNQAMVKTMSKEALPVFSWPQEQYSDGVASPSRPPSPPPTPPGETPKEPPPKPQPPRDLKKESDERIIYWKKRTSAEEAHKQRINFLQSLKGWSEHNTGSHLTVAYGTGSWIVEDKAFNFWRQDPDCGTMLIVGDSGTGKTHLAKGISSRLKASLPSDVIMFFHCVPGQKPVMWEYFTWKLISQDPAWFEQVPVQYRNRDANSPPLSRAAFVEIWNSFRAIYSLQTIYMIVDGLEQCGDEDFEETLKGIHRMRLPVLPARHLQAINRGNKRTAPTRIKIAFTCRPTPAVEVAGLNLTYTTIRPEAVSESISTYIRSRLPLPGGGKEGPSERDLERYKAEVTAYANGYWHFARFAVEHAQQAVLHGEEVQLNASDQAPPGLQAWVRRQLSEKLRKPGLDQVARLVITLMAGVRFWGVYPTRILKDMVRALGPEEKKNYDVVSALTRDWGDFIRVDTGEDSGITFIHESVAYVVSSMIPEKQGHLNFAVVYINYLLLERFAAFANIYPHVIADGGSFESLFKDFSKDNPFYEEAAKSLLHSLRCSGELGLQLEPFLRAFFDRECPQFRTWCAFMDWKQRKSSSFHDPIVLHFVENGCVDVLQHLLPAPNREREPLTGLGLLTAIVGAPTVDECFLDAEDWPETTNAEGETALMKAMQSGKADIIDFVLAYGPKVNARSRTGQTALSTGFRFAAPHTKQIGLGIVEQLLHLGADANTCDGEMGQTPLCYAAAQGDVQAVRLLLRHGARIDVVGAEGESPLEQALFSKNSATFVELVEQGADVDLPFSTGDLPLLMCIERDEVEMFNAVLRVCNINEKAVDGWTTLHMACELRNRNQYIGLLLEHPAIDVDIFEDNAPGARVSCYPLNPPTGTLGQDNDAVYEKLIAGYSFNALSRAVCQSNYEAVEMLLNAGADPGQLPGMKVSPVFLAALQKRLDLVRLLLSFDSPVNVCVSSYWPCTALAIAIREHDEDMVELLLSHGADPTIEDAYGRPGPLYAATVNVKNPNMRIIQMLLSARIPADVNVPYQGIPAISDAVDSNNLELTRLFLDNGADLTRWLEPADSQSPLIVTAMEGYIEICELLIEREPGLMHAQFKDLINGDTPLHAAAAEGRTEVVRLLLRSGARADLLSPVYRESPLLLACRSGNFDCVKLLLDASTKMVHVPDARDLVPFNEACDKGALDTMKALLDGGADFMRKDRLGNCFAPPDFFELNARPLKTVKLLMEYDLDINAPINTEGESILGLAVLEGKARHVRWLLEHGADPLRCQQPLLEGGSWRNALMLATEANDEEVLELLLETQWGLLEHLGDLDNLGGSILSYSYTPRSKARKARIIQAMEKHHAETGEDVLGILLSTPDLYGRTPIDRALGHVGTSLTARPAVKNRVMELIDTTLALPKYRSNDHHILIESIAYQLLGIRGHDAVAIELLTFVTTLTRVSRDEDGPYEKLTAWMTCLVCEDPISNVALACRFCSRMKCVECVDVSKGPLHKCEWMEVPLVKDEAFDLRDHLETLRKDLQAEEVIPPKTGQDTVKSTDREELRLQSSLQLATLHAFNHLAFRRPLFTPYLDLAPSVQELISHWKNMISEQRRFWETDNFLLERHWTRRREEMRYVNMGIGRRYVNEEDVMKMKVLEDVWVLFQLPERMDDGGSVIYD